MANDKDKKRAAKKVEKAVRKAFRKGVTESAIGNAVEVAIGKAGKKKPMSKAARARTDEEKAA
jgi:hypothetical protein